MNISMIQHIKSLVFMAALALPVGVMLSSCSSDNDPFFTANEDDYPVILNSDLETNEEWKNGEPPVLTTITRKENFVYEAIVTPAHYTTVTWFIDDVQVAEGKTIDYGPLPVGEHLLKIVATTTKGKETSRTRKISVTLCNDDPVAGKDIHDRLVKQGSVAQLHGKNISKVTKVIIGTQTVDATYNVGEDCVEYTVPDLSDGVYTLQLVDAEGYVFDAGEIELNTNPQYSGEKVIYTGPSEKLAWSAITWGKEDIPSLGIKPGMIITVYVTADEGAEGAIATSWWNDINSGVKWDAEGGCKQSLPQGESVMTYTVTTTQYLEEQGLGVVGNNFVVEKITIEEPAETVIYEGPSEKLAWNAITWGKEDIPSLGIKVGTVITVYYVADAGAAGAIATSWWNDINSGVKWDAEGGCRQDLPEGEGKMEYEVTNLDYLNEQGLGIVGNAYVIEKVTIK